MGRLCRFYLPIEFNAWIASTLWLSRKWVYLIVWLMLRCPMISATVLMSTPFMIK